MAIYSTSACLGNEFVGCKMLQGSFSFTSDELTKPHPRTAAVFHHLSSVTTAKITRRPVSKKLRRKLARRNNNTIRPYQRLKRHRGGTDRSAPNPNDTEHSSPAATRVAFLAAFHLHFTYDPSSIKSSKPSLLQTPTSNEKFISHHIKHN